MTYAAVVVNYFKDNQCIALASSLAEQQYCPDALVIVDNSGTLKKNEFIDDIPFNLVILSPGYNSGYSVGANLGVSLAISLCPGAYLLLLSPDILFPEKTTTSCLITNYINSGFDHFRGYAQINPDETSEPVARAFPSLISQLSRKLRILYFLFPRSLNSYISAYECSFDPESTPQRVPWLQSSLLLFSAKSWNTVGGLDARYFVFMADVELGHESQSHGIPILLDRTIFVYADGVRASAGGIGDLIFSKVGRIHALDALQYYWKRLVDRVLRFKFC